MQVSNPFPNPPTDSLYKFLALSGLVIFLFSAILPLWLGGDLILKLKDSQSELDVMRLEAKFLMEDLEAAQAAGATKATPEQVQKARDLQIQTAKMSRKTEAAIFLTACLVVGAVFSGIGMWGGLFLGKKGFVFWYDRLQKYQDEILKFQAKPINSEKTVEPKKVSS